MNLADLTPDKVWPDHGGDLAMARARWGEPEAGWLDLSTGISPFPYPIPNLPPEAWTRLPQAHDEAALRAAAAAAWGVRDARLIALAPGSQAIIQALPTLFGPAEIAIPGPAYSGHAAAWRWAGHRVSENAEISEAASIIVVTNPNNPDGSRHAPDRLAGLGARLAARGGLLVVDEAFGDTEPELSLAGAGARGLLVLRSFGKFFGLAGLRLGFAIGEAILIERLRHTIGPWPASGPALLIGQAALSDSAWIAAARRDLAAAATRLDAMFSRSGLALVGGTSLFRLAESPRAASLYDHLGRRGILVRAFPDHPGWLRFGLPPDEAGWRRLTSALAAF